MRYRLIFLVALASPCVSLTVHGQERPPKKKIVLIAGLKSHGPEGNGIHDYAWSARLIKTMLENSNVRDFVQVDTYLNGWPHDQNALKSADTIMIISDGRDGDVGREAPHLGSPERVLAVDQLVQRGCGVVTFHFATFAPDALGSKALDWYGGYFDWETDGKREWYSDITTTEAEVTLPSVRHPIARGVKPFTMREEFYYDIRFRGGDGNWVPIWSVATLPATKPHGNVVAWAVQRKSGSRGFATTCGHFYANWEKADFRKTILNGLAWSAHVEIPDEGVESKFVSREAIALHLAEPELVAASDTEGKNADESVYADDPYWYKPGHPIRPAEAGGITTLPGFQVDKMLTVPEACGSWTAIAVDERGRLICSAQHQPGLYRVTPAGPGADPSATRIEKLKGAAEQMGWSHGLLAAFDSLYVTVNEENDAIAGGVYRLRDLDGDDQYDQVTKLLSLEGAGEHGPHNIVVGPDGNSLYMMCGNGDAFATWHITLLSIAHNRHRSLDAAGLRKLRVRSIGVCIAFSPGRQRIAVDLRRPAQQLRSCL